MTTTSRIAIVPLGMSLGTFFVITYILCILFGLFVPTEGMHRTLLPALLPGFTWISWFDFLIGLVWVFAYGWYIALVFVPIRNFFVLRRGGGAD